jgi:RimJ/RimL family protein N-acetyltransferase
MIVPSNPLELINLQAEALYRYDARGRIVCVNEPEEPPAGRFFMARTAAGNVWRFRNDLPDTLVQQLESLCAAEPPAAVLPTRPAMYDAIRAALAAQAPITEEYRGPAYFFPTAPQPAADAVLIDAGNHGLLAQHFAYEAYPPEAGPAAVVVADGVAVARCFCARLSPHVAEAGLETAEAYRGRGYGAAATQTWAAAVFASGRRALYGTSWENIASQGVARHLGLVLYGEDWSLT